MIVQPIGPKNASILLVGEFPNYDDLRSGYVGSGRVGEILRMELARVGIQLAQCRLVNMWHHAISKDCSLEYHTDVMLPELSGHDWVVLMGSTPTKVFLDKGIMEVSGLKVTSKLFPKIKMFAIPNAGTLLRGDVGEMRLALQKFKERMKSK